MKPVPRKSEKHNSGKPEVPRFSRWIRFYTDTINDPKVQLLDAYTFKAWVNLLALAGTHDQGYLPPIDEVAFRLRMSVQDAQAQINILIDVGLIDIITRSGDSITLQPHNWSRRQFRSDNETSTERVRKHREKIAQLTDETAGNAESGVSCNVSETTSKLFPSESESALQGSGYVTSKNSVGDDGSCNAADGDDLGDCNDAGPAAGDDDDEIPT